MFAIYFGVMFAILAYRVFKAAQTDFTYGPNDSDIDLDKLMPYILFTVVCVFIWPIALPCYGFWLLGKRFKKEEK
jgi:hypothetical protein